MSTLKRFLPTKWWSSFLWAVLTYLFLADLLPNLLMLLVTCIGYLPYSDRPGPGWQAPHWPHKEEIEFFVGFAAYLGVPTLLYGLGQSLLAIVYGICSLPKWLLRLLGAITGYIAAGLLMAAVGWMIAIAPVGVYIASGCGLLWGVLVMPALVVPRQEHLPITLRVALPLLLDAAAIFYLVYPLIPKKPVAPITFELNRITEGEELVRADRTEYLKPETQQEIDGLNLRGRLHGGMQSTQGTNSGDVDVVVLALQPIDHEYKLDVPAKGHVVYVLADGKLTPHPLFQEKESKHIWLRPGVNATYDGGQIKVGDAPEFSAFTWYPTIRR
jgi:hypothetical protein